MSDAQSGRKGFFQSKANITMVVFGAIAAFFLLTEHTAAHVFGALPYLLLLACPLMHFFMHGGHGGHAREDERKEAGRDESGRRDT